MAAGDAAAGGEVVAGGAAGAGVTAGAFDTAGAVVGSVFVYVLGVELSSVDEPPSFVVAGPVMAGPLCVA